MPFNHLILCRSLLLLPSIFPSIWVFSSESALHIRWPKYWSFSFSISPSNEHSGLIPLGWTGWISCSPRDSQESSPTPQFKSINPSALSFLFRSTLTSIHDYWKNFSYLEDSSVYACAKWITYFLLLSLIQSRFLNTSSVSDTGVEARNINQNKSNKTLFLPWRDLKVSFQTQCPKAARGNQCENCCDEGWNQVHVAMLIKEDTIFVWKRKVDHIGKTWPTGMVNLGLEEWIRLCQEDGGRRGVLGRQTAYGIGRKPASIF